MTTPAAKPLSSGARPVLDGTFVAAALGAELRAASGIEARFERAIIDSREAAPGDLFFALPGEHVDGHDFALDAVRRGASGVVLARRSAILDQAPEALDGVAQFYVADPLAALQRLGAAWRRALAGLEIVGITGNVGKTTTRAFVAAVLASKFRVQSSASSHNNEIGVPLTLVGLQPECERAVVEMGMYTTGEISLLCEWAQPRVGVVLNVGPVHLERAGSLDAIVRAKRELVEALPVDGYAILNADDEKVRGMAAYTSARVWTFGTSEALEVDVRGSELVSHGAAGFEFTLTYLDDSRRLQVALPGTHLVSNVLAAATVGLVEGMTLDEVSAALEGLRDTPRMRIVSLRSGVTLLDDTYNANPASMEAALALLSEMPGRKIAVLGDMRELGELSRASHQAIGERAAEVADVLYTVGELAWEMSESARTAGLKRTQHLGAGAESRALAVEVLRATLRAGDSVLVKGSRALALEEVVAGLEGGA